MSTPVESSPQQSLRAAATMLKQAEQRLFEVDLRKERKAVSSAVKDARKGVAKAQRDVEKALQARRG